MAERFKTALERARAKREAPPPATVHENASPPPGNGDVDAAWAALPIADLDAGHLSNNRIIADDAADPAQAMFNALKARLLRVLRKNGWRRIGVTSPTRGCGRTFVAANLALSTAQGQDVRTILVDLDLRTPTLSGVLGVGHGASAGRFLAGDVPANRFLRRIRPNVAFGATRGRSPDAAGALLDPKTGEALKAMEARYQPDLIICDLPPLLAFGDVVEFLTNLDGVLLVAAADSTRPKEITDCERLLADRTQLLGVLLNRAEPFAVSKSGYEYGCGRA